MQRTTILSLFLIIALALAGCIGLPRQGPQSPSAFMESFSIGSVIEANEQYLVAKHTVSSGELFEPPASFFELQELAIIEVDSIQAPPFLQAVRQDIEQALVDNGAQIVGVSGDHPERLERALAEQGITRDSQREDRPARPGAPEDGTHFAFRYSVDQTRGAIHVWGVRGQGTNYTVIVLITES
jgi:hypothetical protein